ncbi:UDP-N-acetylenolpyruvoylglucosamine reductase [Bdellovibrio bacteriovorus]|uniref:UDP-N-acetylenolpyruvoylglucosamine reductase n=1 Tax=Bdellovibrio bacteriovorus TaxID=959 RepID=A0A162GK81_BDEBC|nr:UDP-N-acetylmuramate dehydrogenase [Bdellovibrio bacteriovorus]KYG68357.1 UDP-N-acetylenolpyruvoylglucosamine reductase [Bdellovibrio bacteriovorus]
MQIRTKVDLSSFNTLQLRSQAEHYAELHSPSDLHAIQDDASLKKLTWNILGGGSNLVLPSSIPGLVLKVSNRGKELVADDKDFWFVKVQAGEVWNDFVQWTLQQGFWGLENLSLIPGTSGAAPIQNIGAYGVEIKDTLWEVTCLDLKSGETKVLSNKECQFAYRDSFFKQEGAGRYLVWDVTFRLPKKNVLHLEYGDIRKELERQQLAADPRTIANAVIHIRQTKLPDPRVIGNAGSFFKNPIVSKEMRDSILMKHTDLVSYPYLDANFKLAAGWLIDRAGWKGKKLGPVGMFEKQALVLVNHGGASADDVWKLANQVSLDVKNMFGVEIEPEPIRW